MTLDDVKKTLSEQDEAFAALVADAGHVRATFDVSVLAAFDDLDEPVPSTVPAPLLGARV